MPTREISASTERGYSDSFAGAQGNPPDLIQPGIRNYRFVCYIAFPNGLSGKNDPLLLKDELEAAVDALGINPNAAIDGITAPDTALNMADTVATALSNVGALTPFTRLTVDVSIDGRAGARYSLP